MEACDSGGGSGAYCCVVVDRVEGRPIPEDRLNVKRARQWFVATSPHFCQRNWWFVQAANVSTVPLQDAVIRVKNLRLQEDYEGAPAAPFGTIYHSLCTVEEEETQLFLVADSIQVTISGAKKVFEAKHAYAQADT